MQRERRHNPYPLTWEIPVGIACLLLLLLVLGAHGGRAAANLFAGGGLTFPPATDLFPSSIGLIQGDAGAGLSHPPTDLASSGTLLAWIMAAEVLVLVLGAWAGVAAYLRWGPGRMKGMATKTQAEALLGLTRLRKTRAVVRPDLYGKKVTR